MTSNQLKYAELQEQKRSNLVKESETHRSNVANEAIGWGNVGAQYASINESNRHNQAGETETQRHNEEVEAETNRHNVASETAGYMSSGSSVIKALPSVISIFSTLSAL